MAAGRPLVPSLSIDGRSEPVLHVSQLAEALGLPVRATLTTDRLARDTLLLLDAWLTGIEPLDAGQLLRPTPSRGRSLRNLTVNVFHPFELLPQAWRWGAFPWEPGEDAAREGALADAAAVHRWAAATRAAWGSFLDTVGHELGLRDPSVTSPRGTVPFSVVLDAQRWHAAFHLRQLDTVLGTELLPPLDALALPAAVF